MFKIKNKISKMAPHKWDTAEGRISKLEDVPIGIIQTETQRRKKIKKKQKNKVSKMYAVWDYTKYEKFLKLMKDINPQIQVALANS